MGVGRRRRGVCVGGEGGGGGCFVLKEPPRYDYVIQQLPWFHRVN